VFVIGCHGGAASACISAGRECERPITNSRTSMATSLASIGGRGLLNYEDRSVVSTSCRGVLPWNRSWDSKAYGHRSKSSRSLPVEATRSTTRQMRQSEGWTEWQENTFPEYGPKKRIVARYG